MDAYGEKSAELAVAYSSRIFLSPISSLTLVVRRRGSNRACGHAELQRACGGADLTVRRRGSKSAGEDLTLRKCLSLSHFHFSSQIC